MAGELRRHRERAGLNLSQLAQRVGYSRTYISTSEKPGADLVSEGAVTKIDEDLGAGARHEPDKQNQPPGDEPADHELGR